MFSALAMQDIPEIRDRERTLQADEPPHELPSWLGFQPTPERQLRPDWQSLPLGSDPWIHPEPRGPVSWVERAQARTLPTFSPGGRAFAYIPR